LGGHGPTRGKKKKDIGRERGGLKPGSPKIYDRSLPLIEMMMTFIGYTTAVTYYDECAMKTSTMTNENWLKS